MIPRIVHQIWPGSDQMPESLALLMAKNVKYCNDNDFQYRFWSINDIGNIIVKAGNQYHSCGTEFRFDDRIYKMIVDPKLHPVMKGDILRFVISYLYGGIYADLDLILMNIQDEYLEQSYLCGYERTRNGAGTQEAEFTFDNSRPQQPREEKVVCTAFFGAPPKSPVNFAVITHILDMYSNILRTGRYPSNMWNVLDFTGPDMYVKIIKKFPEVKIFPMEYFFPWPPVPKRPPFSIHYYAGTQPGGWTFDQCKNEDCPTCEDLPICKISREGRR